MAKLRATLPKGFYYGRDFQWTDEEIQKCKDILSSCDVNAYTRGFYKETAMHHYLPIEIISWLIERGADVNACFGSYGSPIFKHAAVGNLDICRLLIENGADLKIEDYAGETVLFYASQRGHADVTALLLEHGADPCHRSKSFSDSLTPLLNMLRGIDYPPGKNDADTAELLLNAQREKGGISEDDWEKAQKYVSLIGHRYEVIKSSNGVYDLENESAMEKLYRLFDVPVSAPVIKHDGKSPITVDEKLTFNEQHNKLWEYLVPVSGKCQTVQGEVIRITGRIADECMGNGGANWDEEYRKMQKALLEFFSSGNGLDDDTVKKASEACHDINSQNACICQNETDTLIKCALEWVKKNPDPILLEKVSYRR